MEASEGLKGRKVRAGVIRSDGIVHKILGLLRTAQQYLRVTHLAMSNAG